MSEGVVSSTACINQVRMFYNENGKKQVGMFYNENGKKTGGNVYYENGLFEQDRECCVGELDIAVRNCSSWVAYRSTPILIQHK